MRRNTQLCCLTAVLLLGACTRAGFGYGSAGDGTREHDGPAHLDKASGPLDGAQDSLKVDHAGGPQDLGGGDCAAKTTDGLFLNPGCDPDVASGGPTLIANAPLAWTGKWGVFSGPRWWIFDTTAGGGQGAFVNGGKSLASLLKQSAPDCTAKTLDGLTMNPGCDSDVQADGFTSMVTVDFGGSEVWFVSHGKKWWLYDATPEAGPAAFVQGGKDLASFVKTMPPDCSYKTSDGMAKNPGCDPDVQALGFSSMGIMYESGEPYWFATTGKKWWLYALGSDAGLSASFVAGGLDMTAFLLQVKPDCAAKTTDGLPLNPGCDLDVKSKGLSDLDVVQIFGKPQALLTHGNKWWLFDLAADGGNGAFVDGGKDVAALLRALKP